MINNNNSYQNYRLRVYQAWEGTTFQYFQRLDSLIINSRNPVELDTLFQQEFRQHFQYVHGQTENDFMSLNVGTTTACVYYRLEEMLTREEALIDSKPPLEKQQSNVILNNRRKRMRDKDEKLLSQC